MHVIPIFLAVLSADVPALEIPAVIKLAEEVAVPARDAGVLAQINAKEGQLVEESDVVARLLDTDIQLAVEKSRLEAEIALRKFKNDVDIRYAKKSTEVAKAELARSLETNEKYAKTVSNSEIDRQRLQVDQGELQMQKADHEREVAGLTHEMRISEHKIACEQLERRTILAPLRGMVVEVLRRRGEWVQAGDAVVRIVRLDHLRAEGFVPAKHASLDLVGRKVAVNTISPDGKSQESPGHIVFVNPEIDPLNSQVRVWADVENPDLKLRPGMQVTLIFNPQ